MLSFSCLYRHTFGNTLQAEKHQKRGQIGRDTILCKWKYKVPVTFQFQKNDFFLLHVPCDIFKTHFFLFIWNSNFTGCPTFYLASPQTRVTDLRVISLQRGDHGLLWVDDITWEIEFLIDCGVYDRMQSIAPLSFTVPYDFVVFSHSASWLSHITCFDQ